MGKKKPEKPTVDHALLVERVERRILLVRGHKVMLDSDLAELYGVETGVLNRAVKRNAERFPEDFMFQLTPDEAARLRCQIGILDAGADSGSKTVPPKRGRGKHRKYLPHVFTEQGVAMMSSVLRSRRAALVNVAIMRAFVKLREMLGTHKDLARKLEELESKYDAQFRVVFDAIRELMTPPETPRRIGFRREETE